MALLFAFAGACGDDAPAVARPGKAEPLCVADQAYALCVCGTLSGVGTLGIQGSLAVNGPSFPRAPVDVSGSWNAWGGLATVAETFVGGNLTTAGDARLAGRTEIDRDFLVGGSLSGDGDLTVAGTLRVSGQDTHLGHKEVGAVGMAAKAPAPACSCAVDVAEEVGLRSGSARGPLPPGDTELGPGEHYFEAPSTMAGRRLVVSGDATLYLGGSVDELGPDQISLAPGATLDVWVGSDLSRLRPVAGVRWFVGGTGIVLVSTGDVALYAPRAEVWYTAEATLRGALVVDVFHGVGPVDLIHDASQSCR